MWLTFKQKNEVFPTQASENSRLIVSSLYNEKENLFLRLIELTPQVLDMGLISTDYNTLNIQDYLLIYQ